MNIAFTTVMVLVLLAPGYLFWQVFFSTKLSVSKKNLNLTGDFALAIIPALIIHLILVLVIEGLPSIFPTINYQMLGQLIIGTQESEGKVSSFPELSNYKFSIIIYILSSLIISSFLGYSVRKIIRKYKLDIKIRFFRFSNKWHYLFSGECLDFDESNGETSFKHSDINFKSLNVLCEVNGLSYLYTGEFYNYEITSEGDLDYVQLKYPYRRLLENDSKDENKYYRIPSLYFLIPAASIININFNYTKWELVESDTLNEDEKNNAINFEDEEIID